VPQIGTHLGAWTESVLREVSLWGFFVGLPLFTFGIGSVPNTLAFRCAIGLTKPRTRGRLLLSLFFRNVVARGEKDDREQGKRSSCEH
jgi:hypothetical protein